MSYCRFSDGDVYMILHVGGFVECLACKLNHNNSQGFDTFQQAYTHLEEHVAADHDVPVFAFERLKEDIKTGKTPLELAEEIEKEVEKIRKENEIANN